MRQKTGTIVTIILCLAISLTASMNSWAVVNGTRDCEYNEVNTPGINCSQPEVGSMVWYLTEDRVLRNCTNRLISKSADKAVILSAAHCFASIYPAYEIGVNFDAQIVDDSYVPYRVAIRADRSVAADRVILHPYNQSSNVASIDPLGNAQGYTVSDFALIVIEDPHKLAQLEMLWGFADGQYANLLPEDYLASLSHEEFTELPVRVAGLGADWKDYDDPSTWHNIGLYNNMGFRTIAELTLASLSSERILTRQNQMQELEGICYGDSGSSAYLLDNVSGEVSLVAMPTWVNDGANKCHSTVQWVRLDRPNARDFINCAFVDGDGEAVQACVDHMFPLQEDEQALNGI